MSEQTQQPPAPATPQSDPQHPEHHFQHDVEKTELEKWINAGLTKIEPYSNQILMGFIGVAVVIVGFVFWSRSAGSSQTAAWEQFVENSAPEDFMAQADKNPDSPVGAWALLQAGRLFLAEGMQTALTNREASDTQLNNAADAFQKLIKRDNVPAKAREQALYGLGTAQEVLNGNNPDEALQTYQKLISEYPDSQLKPWVERRIAELESKETQQFYAWFREQNPSPTDFRQPNDGLPPNRDIPPPPDNNLDLLKELDLLKPSGVGAENTNSVPSDEEMKKAEDAKSDKTEAPAFPAPGGLEAPKSPAEGDAPPKSDGAKPATEDAESEAKEAPAKPEPSAAPEEEKPATEPAGDSEATPETGSDDAPAAENADAGNN